MRAFGTLAALAAFASCTLFLAGTGSMRRIELVGAPFGQPQPARSYVPLSDNNGFGTNAAFIDKGNLPEGMADDTRGAVLMDQHVRNVAPEGGYIADQAVGGGNNLQQKVRRLPFLPRRGVAVSVAVPALCPSPHPRCYGTCGRCHTATTGSGLLRSMCGL
jgi:hypothetical protein